ncbi:MAG: FHA domain-containing protein [bacterium]
MNAQAMGFLAVETGTTKGEKIEIHPGSKITFGRSKNSDVHISDKTVSRRHAELQMSEDGIFFKNIGINGTLVNSKKIRHHEIIQLNHSVPIEIGRCKLSLDISDFENTIIMNRTMALSNGSEKTFEPSRKEVLPAEARLSKNGHSKSRAQKESAGTVPAISNKEQARRYLGMGYKIMKKTKPAHFIAIAALLLTGTLLFLPVKFPVVVDTYGKIDSAQKWVLVKGQEGQLMASVFNYETGLSEGYRVSNFERGSSVRFSFHPSLAPGRFIAKGDTIGSLYSSEMQERLLALNRQLAAAQGSLAVNASGEKAAIVREAQQRLSYARKKIEEQQKVLARTREAFRLGVISQKELEAKEGEANLLEIEISIAESQLEAAQTGEKPEQLELILANIAALKNEIAAIKEQAAAYTLTAPISGKISRAFSSDTLLTISDTTRYVAFIPVKWDDYSYVARAQNVRLRLSGMSKAVGAKVISLNREIQMLNGEKVIFATALLEDYSEALMPGMLAGCQIEGQPVTALEYVKRFFSLLTA